MGKGDEHYEKLFRQLKTKAPERLSINLKYDPKLAKRIYSAADVYLMPSRFEPCGLGQMIAMRYGTMPLVRATGGMKDTVQDFDPKTGKGNGILFEEYSKTDLLFSSDRLIISFALLCLVSCLLASRYQYIYLLL